MKRSSTVGVDSLTNRRPFVALVAAVAALWLMQSQVRAQDMSFDLDEAEELEEADDVMGGDSVGGDGGDDDFLSDITGESELTIGGDADTERKVQTDKEIVEEIYAVQQIYALRDGRFELAPSVAFTMNDPFISHPAAAVALNYWVTNVLAIGANFLWYQELENQADINRTIQRSFRLAVPVTEYQLGAHLNFTYVPIYGKFSMFNEYIFQWDAYLIGGVGMMRTRPVPVVDPAIRSFDYDWRVSFNAGIGLCVFVTRFLTVFAELRDYLYLERYENTTVELGAAREDQSTWLDESATLNHNVAVHLGVTVFFPFTFDYRLPK
jgi:outer membrane beta-barrel protein